MMPARTRAMRRFEFNDGKSQKFWEIALEGDSFSVRYGRIGADGQSSTKTYASAADAEKEANKLIASKVKKGYAEVAVDEVAAPKATTGNPDLEQAIHADPNDLDAWAVYGDWLQEQGDPRGELIGLEVAKARGQKLPGSGARREAILQENHDAWVGPVLAKTLADDEAKDEGILEVEWKFGFLSRVRITTTYDWEGHSTVEHLKALLKLESAKFLGELVIGLTDLEGDTQFDTVILPLSKVGKLPALRRLTIGDFGQDEQEITWTTVGKIGRLWPVLPNLEYLRVRGGGIELGAVDHEKLKELVLETAGLPRSSVKSLAGVKMPSLERLEVWIGNEERSEEHGEHSQIEDWAPLLSGEGFPALKDLGLMNCDYQDAIAVAMCTAPIVKQLERLDMSMGTMGEIGARALLEHKAHFAHLHMLDVHDNSIAEAEEAQLREAFGERVRADDQDPEEDPEDRYISVSE